jgi:hypothetical protein
MNPFDKKPTKPLVKESPSGEQAGKVLRPRLKDSSKKAIEMRRSLEKK